MIKYLKVSFTEREKERIFKKISIESKSGCWNWIAAKVKGRGYGVFNFRGNIEMTHRLMYAWMVKPIPYGMKYGVIDHVVCNNRACCNPKHMTFGSQKRNALRGDSPPSINARKTHCVRGHLLPKPNEFWGKNRIGRRCIICRRSNAMKRYYLINKK